MSTQDAHRVGLGLKQVDRGLVPAHLGGLGCRLDYATRRAESRSLAKDSAPAGRQPQAVRRDGQDVDDAALSRPDGHAIGPRIERELAGLLVEVPDANDLIKAGRIKRLAVRAKRQRRDIGSGTARFQPQQRRRLLRHHRGRRLGCGSLGQPAGSGQENDPECPKENRARHDSSVP